MEYSKKQQYPSWLTPGVYPNGSVNELKSIFIAGVWAKTPVAEMIINVNMLLIITYQLN